MVRIAISLLVIAGGLVTAGLAAANGAGSEAITYSYDAKGRLVLVQHSGTVNNNVVANYTYDTADNRRNLKVTGAP